MLGSVKNKKKKTLTETESRLLLFFLKQRQWGTTRVTRTRNASVARSKEIYRLASLHLPRKHVLPR